MPSRYPDGVSSLATVLETQLRGVECPLSPARRAAVRECVCEYVDVTKALGWPPERVIAAVKQIAVEAGLAPSYSVTSTAVHLSGTDRLVADIVDWSIARYYDGTDATR